MVTNAKKNIYIIDTQYHLLISIAKTLLDNRVGKDSVIIMRKNISSKIVYNVQFLFKDCMIYSNRFKILLNVFLTKIQQNKIPFLSQIIKKRNFLFNFIAYDSEIYIYDDNSYFGCWLNNAKIYYNHIEDGLDNFKLFKYKNKRIKIYDFIYRLLGISWDYWGTSKFIKSIEVNENRNLRLSHNNIIVQNREQMFKKLTPEQIDIIARIFNYKPLKNIVSGDKTLLLTQPLSEDSLVSHETKIHIYKHLVDKYAIGKLYIKIHPREKEDYTKLFPDAIILGNQDIPFEVYQLKEKFHFKKAITVFSTAINAVFCADEKISMSPEWMMNFSKKS